jgi:hypothetical protein
MASFIVYVKSTHIEAVNNWLANPTYINVPFSTDDVKIYMEEKDPDFVLMMVNHHEFVLLNDFMATDSKEHKKGVIDRKTLLREYLKRIGADPNKTFSIGSSAIDEVLQIGVDIIEESYIVKEKENS